MVSKRDARKLSKDFNPRPHHNSTQASLDCMSLNIYTIFNVVYDLDTWNKRAVSTLRARTMFVAAWTFHLYIVRWQILPGAVHFTLVNKVSHLLWSLRKIWYVSESSVPHLSPRYPSDSSCHGSIFADLSSPNECFVAFWLKIPATRRMVSQIWSNFWIQTISV